MRRNPATLLIAAFQILLVTAAISLVLGNLPAANEISVYSLCALVGGVAIQLGMLVREERKRTRADSGGSSNPS